MYSQQKTILSSKTELNLKNPVTREHGTLNGKGFKNRYETNSSTASSTKQAENKCEAAHLFATLKDIKSEVNMN